MRRSVEIKLTEADRSELERLARGRRVWRSLSDRAHIVLLAAEGLTNVQIANTLGINSPPPGSGATGLRSSVWTGSKTRPAPVVHGASMTTLWPR